MAALVHMIIKADMGDYVTCAPHNGLAETGAAVPVAKPYLSRRTVFETDGRDGFSYTYTTNAERTSSKSGLSNETQVMTPNVVVGDEVWVAESIEGGTAVVDTNNNPVTRQVVTWGRGWMEK